MWYRPAQHCTVVAGGARGEKERNCGGCFKSMWSWASLRPSFPRSQPGAGSTMGRKTGEARHVSGNEVAENFGIV